jgi:hypothetical protein
MVSLSIMLSTSWITLQNYSYSAKKLQKKSTFTRQVVLNLILDRNYILTGWAGREKFGYQKEGGRP